MAIFSVDDKNFFANGLGKLKSTRSTETEAHCSRYFEAVNRGNHLFYPPNEQLNRGFDDIGPVDSPFTRRFESTKATIILFAWSIMGFSPSFAVGTPIVWHFYAMASWTLG